MKKLTKKQLFIATASIVALVCLWLLWVWYALGDDAGTNHPVNSEITNFEECAAAGNLVAESYPRQCSTADGQHFVEDVELPES